MPTLSVTCLLLPNPSRLPHFFSIPVYNMCPVRPTENELDPEITEKQAWNIASALAAADLALFQSILNQEIEPFNHNFGTLVPIPIFGPSHPYLQQLILVPSIPPSSSALLQAFLRIKLLLLALPDTERRIMWLDGSLERRTRPLITLFRTLFKEAPSPAHFAHMTAIVRLCHQILASLDIKYPCFLEAPSPDNAVPLPQGPCITILSWGFPPRNVDPVTAWDPPSWPSWRFWPLRPFTRPVPLTTSLFNPLNSTRWVARQRLVDHAIISSLNSCPPIPLNSCPAAPLATIPGTTCPLLTPVPPNFYSLSRIIIHKMKLLAFPSNFWVFHDEENSLCRTFVPTFQCKLLQSALARPSDTPLVTQDLLALLEIQARHSSDHGLQLQAKVHFLRFLPLLTRLEPFPHLHNLLMTILSDEWFGYLLSYDLD